jgi:hypothetical protein
MIENGVPNNHDLIAKTPVFEARFSQVRRDSELLCSP